MLKKLAIAVSIASFSVLAVQASNNAADNASPTNYPGGTWNTSTNGGYGFGSWLFSTGGGTAGSYIGGTGDGNPAFGLFANGGAFSNVTRPFTGGGLSPGQTFSLDVGNTSSVGTGAQIGLNLLDGSNNPVFTFEFTGGQSFWQLNDGAGNFNTSIPFQANNSIDFAFTYLGAESYNVVITDGNVSDTYTGLNFTAHDDISDISAVKLFDNGQGGGENFGFNDLQIVPEPSTIAAGVLALFGAVFLRRRRANV